MCLALELERPDDVLYSDDSQTVTFRPPTTITSDVCLYVRLLSDSSSWTSQLHCASVDTGSVKLHDVVDDIWAVEVSFCVRHRPDVCGPAQNATIGQYSWLQFHKTFCK